MHNFKQNAGSYADAFLRVPISTLNVRLSTSSTSLELAPSFGLTVGAARVRRRRWRDGNACTTSVLHTFLRGAYTDKDSLVFARSGRICVFLEAPQGLGSLGSGPAGARGSVGKVRIALAGQESTSVEDVRQFPAVERRRNPAMPSDQREKGEVAVFQELGKALTSSLQLDQVLRTIMEKIDEFLRPDNWSLLLLDEEKQELYFELAVGKASQALRDVRIKMGQGIAGWVAQHGETVVVPDTSKDTRFFAKVDEKTKTETQSIVPCQCVSGTRASA